MSHVKVSFDSPEYVANVDGRNLRILEAVRILGLKKPECFSTSELYGGLADNKKRTRFFL
jgi:GDPmannose 4,6-dehydratase